MALHGCRRERVIVALQFPNPSRSYDATRHCVCFWGYDNSREITFQVDDAVLRNLQPDAGSDERSILGAFDQSREKLLAIARKQYVNGPQNRYTIV
jgi:peptidyl-tRNA hydrolase